MTEAYQVGDIVLLQQFGTWRDDGIGRSYSYRSGNVTKRTASRFTLTGAFDDGRIWTMTFRLSKYNGWVVAYGAHEYKPRYQWEITTLEAKEHREKNDAARAAQHRENKMLCELVQAADIVVNRVAHGCTVMSVSDRDDLLQRLREAMTAVELTNVKADQKECV